jgi:hypothetical protein
MINTRVFGLVLLAMCTIVHAEEPKQIRIGMIGLDTSHAPNFTTIFNGDKPDKDPALAGLRVTVAFPVGSPDMKKESMDRVPAYVKQMSAMGVEMVDSVEALLPKCDVVMIESVDGRAHLKQAKAAFASGKLIFIDKPLAASLADGIAIAEMAKAHNVTWFSSSALRFSAAIANMAHDPKLGEIVGCQAWSPCHLDPTHPDFFWYGIHGVETLYTIMGTGCTTVTRATTEGSDQATGVWADGRIGTFYGLRKAQLDFGATTFGTKGVACAPQAFKGYEPLMVEIAKFFKTGKAPIAPEQTIEILAFMEAADVSKKEGGKPVTIASVMEKAKAEAASKK